MCAIHHETNDGTIAEPCRPVYAAIGGHGHDGAFFMLVDTRGKAASSHGGSVLPALPIHSTAEEKERVALNTEHGHEVAPFSSVGFKTRLGLLTSLNLRGCGISSLEVVKSLKFLLELDVAENRLICLDELVNCPELRIVRAEHNSISELYGLTRLEKLTEIDLTGNNITDLIDVAWHPRLRTLVMGKNIISSCGDCLSSHYCWLLHVALPGNSCWGWSALSGSGDFLPMSPAHAENKLTSFGPIPPQLQTLDLSYNCIARLEDVFTEDDGEGGQCQLWSLTLSANCIELLEPDNVLAMSTAFPHIECLDLSDQKMGFLVHPSFAVHEALAPLARLSSLRSLSMRCTLDGLSDSVFRQPLLERFPTLDEIDGVKVNALEELNRKPVE
eukprot:GHVU01133664.1.p1 GENE.GHVU01133664.1~~GHVU01133664.1.p1  ORF type:complete len:387 (-),score=14.14 GHVU01133664.1:742-1902(-)